MYLTSLILIFIESTIGAMFLSFIITLPFLTSLINKNLKNGYKYSFLFAAIYSIQNNSFLYFLMFFLLYSLGVVFILHYLKYEKKNLFFFTLFQMIITVSFFFNKVNSIILCGIGFIALNYLYIKTLRPKKKD